jgi:hypothetical protein
MALNIDNPSIEIGQTVNITSWTLTVPAGSDPVLSTAARNAACNAIVDLIDVGTPVGHVEIRDGSTVLVDIELGATAFGSAATGVATLAGVPLSGTAVAAGDADNYIVYDGDDAAIWSGTVA